MKVSTLFACMVATIVFFACENDVQEPMEGFEYHAHIHSPDNSMKMLGDTLHIDVEFESHTGMPIHHANVRIYIKASDVEVYSKPDDPHIDAENGMFAFEDEFILSGANGITGDTDYVLEAKVWAHDDGEAEIESVEFHVLP